MNNDKKYKFYHTDPFGNNDCDEQFNKIILPLLKKYKVKEKDIDVIVNAITEMVDIAYDNGAQNEYFSSTENN